MREHPQPDAKRACTRRKEFNSQRYHFQGIGRYAPEAAYARGLADLRGAGAPHPGERLCARAKPTSIDAGIYGFIANIYFYDIDTPLKQFVARARQYRRGIAPPSTPRSVRR